jgi:hypothetical protein
MIRLALIASIAVVSGCASFVAVDPSAPIKLGSGEGFVILHIDTNVELETIRGVFTELASNVPIGESAWMIRTSAGNYEWDALKFRDKFGDLWLYDLSDVPDANFTVEAQKVNYAGQILIRVDWREQSLYAEHRNRSAQVYRLLRESHANILESYPLRYGGKSRHDFLEFLTPHVSSKANSTVKAKGGER